MIKIQLLGNEEDLDNGFYVIITSGESSVCLKNEMYIVNKNIVKILEKNNIKFKPIEK